MEPCLVRDGGPRGARRAGAGQADAGRPAVAAAPGRTVLERLRGQPTPSRLVRAFGRVRLYAFEAAAPTYRSPVLLVASPAAPAANLDLAPGRSLVAYLAGKGVPTYLLDWGTPGLPDRYATLEDHAVRYVGAAVRAALADAGTVNLHLAGWSLGGSLAAIHAALRPERVAGVVTLWAPLGPADGARWPTSAETVPVPEPTLSVLRRHVVGGRGLVDGRLLVGEARVALGSLSCPVLAVVEPTGTADEARLLARRAARELSLDGFTNSSDAARLGLPDADGWAVAGPGARDELYEPLRAWLVARPCVAARGAAGAEGPGGPGGPGASGGATGATGSGRTGQERRRWLGTEVLAARGLVASGARSALSLA